MERKALVKISLCVGLVQIAAYYLLSSLAGMDAGVSIAQPDTLVYCQAARRVAEGAPFSYAAGAPVSTGTTSVLYPFLLAVPYLLGATGDSLLVAGFALNALLYLVFLLGWVEAACNWLKSPAARVTAALLVSLAGQSAYSAMTQSDIGCWMAVSALFAWGLSADRRALWGVALALAPWVRPEGLACVAAVAAVAAVRAARGDRRARGDLAVAAVAALSAAGVFAFNFALTGAAQFSSVAHKGHLSQFGLLDGVSAAAVDLMKILKGVALGLPGSAPRDFYMVPLVGGVLLWWGAACRDWRGRAGAGFAAMALAALGGAAMTALSGWQGTNVDRYLAWILPVASLLVAEGAALAAERVDFTACRQFPAVVSCVYAAGCAAVFMSFFHAESCEWDRRREFARECARTMPSDASMAGFGFCGAAYYLGDRPFVHLTGMYSPEFLMRTVESRFELLKRRRDLRFDYWFLDDVSREGVPESRKGEFFGSPVASGPGSYELYRADWRLFDESARCFAGGAGLALADYVDVAFETDEAAHRYEIVDRYRRPLSRPFLDFGEIGGTALFDAGRLVVGGDWMDVSLRPGKDVRVVVRTARKCGGRVKCELADPSAINVEVDGELVGRRELAFTGDGMEEIAFVIPGSALKTSPVRIGFLGDHVAYGYWFYQ